MKPKLEIKGVLLIFVMVIFLLSAIIRDNYYLNMATIIAGCLTFFIINILEPIKIVLVDRSFNLAAILSIIINLSITILALFYLLGFTSSVLIITFIVLCIIAVLLDFFFKKKRELGNYFLILVLLIYLFTTFYKV